MVVDDKNSGHPDNVEGKVLQRSYRAFFIDAPSGRERLGLGGRVQNSFRDLACR